MSDRYEKLKKLLKELFQLDQPDLDFGLYRIMHAKADEVTQFLDTDLLPQVKQAFEQYRPADKAALEKSLAEAIAQAQALGAAPESLPKVKELRAALKSASVDIAALESEVYDHLFGFFRRYYSDGDYLAKRVYKPGVYAIPYEGEEVKLHWANRDQYYIKTSEYLRDYAFRLRPNSATNPLRVHFCLIDAAEGEHGNVKASDDRARVFILAKDDFVAEVDGEQGKELSLRFEYRVATLTDWPDAERPGKLKAPSQKELTALATKRVLSIADATTAAWLAELSRKAPTDKDPNRVELEKQLDRYTKRNTFDYFIHKDLGGFLRRELDFYIKNEVMHLDDIENESAPRVDQYLSKVKVIRRIAGKIITFLAQLEDFQKKLWLKKKFVVETQYCITLARIPEEYYPAIATNDSQREEWVQLFAIDEIKGDMITPGYTVPLTPEFLRTNPTLVVDSRHFDAHLTASLVESIGGAQFATDGVVVCGENMHALALMQRRHEGDVAFAYIDPPYNTGGDGFSYKDAYQRSSWLAMVSDRLMLGRRLLTAGGVFISSIDDIEQPALRWLMDAEFGTDNYIGTMVWKGATDNNPSRIAVEHEYLLCYARSKSESAAHWSTADHDAKQIMLDAFERFRRDTHSQEDVERRFQEFTDEKREELGDLYRYRLVDKQGPYASRRNMENPGKPGYKYDVPHPISGKPCTMPSWGWRFPPKKMESLLANDRIIFGDTEQKIPELKVYLREVKFPLRSVIALDARKGSNDLDRLFGSRELFKNPKPAELLGTLLPFVSPPASTALDFFAGSGTTGQAIINLNREDGGRRRFILVEMGDHFDTLLLPRLKKVTYAPEWKDGKPKRGATIEESQRGPCVIKVIRLESYEDALNNLGIRRTSTQQTLLGSTEARGSDGLKEQYLLQYMLDVETRGSQSLLNVKAFADPTAYKLKVKRPGSDESREVNVDLLETFNWLVGLTVMHIAAPKTFDASFERDSEKRLRVKGRLTQNADGAFWFRSVTGTTPDGRKALIIWRKLTGDLERDNLVLDEWFTKQGYSTRDSEFELIYVNGDSNLENLKTPEDTWKVRLIEEDFHRLMFDTEGL